MPLSAVKLIRSMLQLDPGLRPTFTEILKSEFILEDQEYLKAWREECKKEEEEAEKEKAAAAQTKEKSQEPDDGDVE